MFPVQYRDDEEINFLRRTYQTLPWYKKLFFPSALKEALRADIDFRTPSALWTLYDAYFNKPGWFQRYFNWSERFDMVETTMLLAALAKAGLLTGDQGKENFYTLMSNDENHQQHIIFMLRHYPHLFEHALNPQQDFNRIFITYERELMFESLMGMIVTQGLAHADDIGHMLDPMAPQGKGGIYYHKLQEWAFIHPLYQSHIDGIVYAKQANNREEVTYHVNSLLDALKHHDIALASLAMIMDAKVDRITQVLLDKQAREQLEKQENILADIECDIANFHVGLDSNEYDYNCIKSLNSFRKSIITLSHIYTGTDQTESWQKIRADLLEGISFIINHKIYKQLKNEQEFDEKQIDLVSFAKLLRRMVADDWANHPEKSELVRQSKLLVYAVSLLATLDESFIDNQPNKQSVIEHKFFKTISNFMSKYGKNTQQDEDRREAANQVLTKEACTYLHGLEKNSLFSNDEKESLKEQILSLYQPFPAPNSMEEAPNSPYESLLATHQSHNRSHTFPYLLSAINQATDLVLTNDGTDFLWQLINQRIGSLTADLEPQQFEAIMSSYTPEIHNRLINQLKPAQPYVYLIAAYGALYLAAQVPPEDQNRYIAQAFQLMTSLMRHIPYPVNEALTNHSLWRFVLSQCQEKIISFHELKFPITEEPHPKALYYKAVFFKQCQLLAENYEHHVASLSRNRLSNECFFESSQSPIPFTLQDSKHIRRQIEMYYQGNETFYFYGLAKAAYPLNVQTIKAKLGLNQSTTTVTEEEAYQYIEAIKSMGEEGLDACHEQGLILQGEQQNIVAINEPDYLLFSDYQLLHRSHLLSDLYLKIDTTDADESYKKEFIDLLGLGATPLPLTFIESELKKESLNNPDALQCLLASLSTLITNYKLDSLHPLFIPSLPFFKETIHDGEALLKRCKGKTALKQNNKKELLELVDKLCTLEQSIDNQSAYLRTRGLIHKSQAHLPLSNKGLRHMVYQFIADKPSPTIGNKKELNDFLDSIHGDISLRTLSKCIDYVIREPQWTLNKEKPPLIKRGAQPYKSIRMEYGEIPIQNLINTLVKRFHDFGGQALFTAIRNEMGDNAMHFSDAIQGTISISEIENNFDEERYPWASDANKLSRYYRGEYQPITLSGEKSKERSHFLEDIDLLWKNQPWQTQYGFSQTPNLPTHVKEVLRMQALLMFCHQKAPYFYAPYNLRYELQNGAMNGVIGVVTAPWQIIRHPINTVTGFYRTFLTGQGLSNLANTFYHHPARMTTTLVTASITGGVAGYGGGMLWKASHATTTASVISYKATLPTAVAGTTVTTTTLVEPSNENQNEVYEEINSNEIIMTNAFIQKKSGKQISIELTRESLNLTPKPSNRNDNISFFKPESAHRTEANTLSEDNKENDDNLMSSIAMK